MHRFLLRLTDWIIGALAVLALCAALALLFDAVPDAPLPQGGEAEPERITPLDSSGTAAPPSAVRECRCGGLSFVVPIDESCPACYAADTTADCRDQHRRGYEAGLEVGLRAVRQTWPWGQP